MVTPEVGTATFVGQQSGTRYSVSVYVADVLLTQCKFNSQGTAASTSPAYVQFNEPVVWTDFSIITGNTVTTNLLPTAGGVLIPQRNISIADHLNTLPFRPAIGIPYKAGTLIGCNEA